MRNTFGLTAIIKVVRWNNDLMSVPLFLFDIAGR